MSGVVFDQNAPLCLFIFTVFRVGDVIGIWPLASLKTTYLLRYLSVVKSTLHADTHTSRCIYSRAEEQQRLEYDR